MSCRTVLFRSLLLVVLCARTVSAQSWVDWAKWTPRGPQARIEHTFVYDSVSNRFVMFGGYDLNWTRVNDIWEYDAGTKTWVNVTPAAGTQPTPRSGHAMAFDPIRRTVILFGGLTDAGTYLNDTWEWNTVTKTWTNVTPATSPSERQGARLVHEAANGRLILVGGVDANQYFGQTWVWNLGSRTWTQIFPSVSSAAGRLFLPRTFPGAAYNPTPGRGVTVFGGIGLAYSGGLPVAPTLDFNDTWELRGNVWTDVTPAAGSPPGRGWTQLAYDEASGRVVMFAGYRVEAPQVSYGDTWAFSAGAWSLLVPEGAGPGARDSHGMAYDPVRQRMVVFGGYLADVLEFAGGSWTRVLETVWPPGQDQHAMAYDSDRNVVFLYGGGSLETWELTVPSGSWNWYYVPGPNGRRGTSVVYDRARRRMVLFGGRQHIDAVPGPRLNDTWVWEPTARTWTNVLPAASPAARDDHAMAYDVAHGKTVLFGGRNAGGTALADTWLWNGASWTNVTATAAGPSARFGHAMAYDAVRNVLVLVGGDNGAQKFQDVWEWNGNTERWQQVWPAGPLPTARSFAGLSSFSATIPGVVLFGGTGASLLGDAWIWNGTAWAQANANAGSSGPSARQHPGLVFDPTAQRLVMYGGRDAGGVTADLWHGTVTASAVWPSPVSVTPSQGSGASATFTAVYRHAGGAAQIRDVAFLINTAVTGATGVFLYYAPASNTLFLRNDMDTGWSSGTIGSSLTLANNQVSISLASAGAGVAGSDVTLTLPLVFKTGFNGPKQIYMHASDQGGAASAGWQQKGTFFVSNGNSIPQMVSVTPATGHGGAQTFTAVYRDLNGANDLQQAFFLMNTTINGGNAVYVYYAPQTNTLHLRNDSDTGWLLGTPGGGGVLANSQVSIALSQVSLTKGATDLVLTMTLSFSQAFAGSRNIYLFGRDASGAHPPSYQQLGAYGVWTGVSPPMPPSIAGDDLVVYRPETGVWYRLTGASNYASSSVDQWGLLNDQPVNADFDGDRRPDLVVYRPSTGEWLVKTSSSGFTAISSYQWGLAGDVPVPADFDGDGRTDLVVYRPTDGTWLIRFSGDGYNLSGWKSYPWGLAGDVPLHADFDGDRKADLVVYRPLDGSWVVRTSSSNYSAAAAITYQWGLAGDVPLPGDFDGDGKTDLAVYRPADGSWLIRYSSTGYSYSRLLHQQWGLAGDVPVLGDFDADGRTELAVWRPATGAWYFRYSLSGHSLDGWKVFFWGQPGDLVQPQSPLSPRPPDLTTYRPANGVWSSLTAASGWAGVTTRQWGLSGDQPLRADFDGDRLPDLVVYRPSTGEWFVRHSATNFTTHAVYQWGLGGDVPVPADFDGDGRADLVVYRPSTGLWYIIFSSSGYAVANWASYQWGISGDLPLRADFDGDGRADLAVYRPSDGTWWGRLSSTGYSQGAYVTYQWGLGGDIAMPEDFDGDGKADLVVYRPATGVWSVRFSSSQYSLSTWKSYEWGASGDHPVLGDFDGDGKADLIVWRPSNATWWVRLSSHAYNVGTWRVFQVGLPGDVPMGIR